MDKYKENLQSDITSIKDFEKVVLADKERGYDVGTSLDTLEFQCSSLTFDFKFFYSDIKITRASDREARGLSVGNLIMNLEGQKQKLMLEF